jgi:hypothetical protein
MALWSELDVISSPAWEFGGDFRSTCCRQGLTERIETVLLPLSRHSMVSGGQAFKPPARDANQIPPGMISGVSFLFRL